MTLEIRPITENEIEEAETMTAYAFNSPERRNLEQAVERAKRFFSTDWSLASFEDGEMTAFVRSVPFAQRINGRGLSFAAVGPVVSAPQHRRKGHVGALLRRWLELMRERGQVLSGLHTPHPTLYQRYGWEISSEARTYTFAPKDVALKTQPSERGRIRQITAEDWRQADRLYRLYSKDRNGSLHRGEVWWREGVFQSSQPNPVDGAIWEDGGGEAQGYVLILQPTRREFAGEERVWPPEFLIRELVALTPDAYLNLLAYCLRHDLPEKMTWQAPVYDPFLSLVDDASKLKVEKQYDLLLRVCDAETALQQRPLADPETQLSFTVELQDPSAPWNEGGWRITTGDGAVEVERANGEPDISLSGATLAPLFNGFLSPTLAALTGRVKAKDEEALATADKFFATIYPPFCTDGF